MQKKKHYNYSSPFFFACRCWLCCNLPIPDLIGKLVKKRQDNITKKKKTLQTLFIEK